MSLVRLVFALLQRGILIWIRPFSLLANSFLRAEAVCGNNYAVDIIISHTFSGKADVDYLRVGNRLLVKLIIITRQLWNGKFQTRVGGISVQRESRFEKVGSPPLVGVSFLYGRTVKTSLRVPPAAILATPATFISLSCRASVKAEGQKFCLTSGRYRGSLIWQLDWNKTYRLPF